MYEINREEWPIHRFEKSKETRNNPFFFALDPDDDRQSRTITVYRPRARVHSHIQMAIWFTGGWLCKKRGDTMVPVVPILAVSEPTKLQYFGSSPSVLHTMDFFEWKTFQTPFHYRPIIHDRIPEATREVVREVEVVAKPTPIPAYVAEMLLKKAQAATALPNDDDDDDDSDDA
jgi:hypothetical protein